MWELLKVEKVGDCWTARVDEGKPLEKVPSGWAVPTTYVTFSLESKYDALWKMALVLNRCGVPD